MSPRYRVRVNGRDFDVEVGEASGSTVEVTVDGESYEVELGEDLAAEAVTSTRGRGGSAAAESGSGAASQPRAAGSSTASTSNAVTALMPGRVISVEVEPGQRVSAGQPVLVVESMKMEQTISSPREGVVASVLVSPGDAVAYGQSLVEFE